MLPIPFRKRTIGKKRVKERIEGQSQLEDLMREAPKGVSVVLKLHCDYKQMTMSLRSKLKVPKYRLFYFESNRTLSVLPSAKIRSVVTGDNTMPGSVVQVQYGADVLQAKIITADGKDLI